MGVKWGQGKRIREKSGVRSQNMRTRCPREMLGTEKENFIGVGVGIGIGIGIEETNGKTNEKSTPIPTPTPRKMEMGAEWREREGLHVGVVLEGSGGATPLFREHGRRLRWLCRRLRHVS